MPRRLAIQLIHRRKHAWCQGPLLSLSDTQAHDETPTLMRNPRNRCRAAFGLTPTTGVDLTSLWIMPEVPLAAKFLVVVLELSTVPQTTPKWLPGSALEATRLPNTFLKRE